MQVAYRADQPDGFKFSLVMPLAQLTEWQTHAAEHAVEAKSDPLSGDAAEITLNDYLGTKPGENAGTAFDVVMSLAEIRAAGKLEADDPNNYVRFVKVEDVIATVHDDRHITACISNCLRQPVVEIAAFAPLAQSVTKS